MVPDVAVDSIEINSSNIGPTLGWGEPFNNFDPIVNYTVSCSGDVRCPASFTTNDNTTRSYAITNLTTMTTYTFSVVATNSIGSGEGGLVMITTPDKAYLYVCILKAKLFSASGITFCICPTLLCTQKTLEHKICFP